MYECSIYTSIFDKMTEVTIGRHLADPSGEARETCEVIVIAFTSIQSTSLP
jgi:hypothetical protein